MFVWASSRPNDCRLRGPVGQLATATRRVFSAACSNLSARDARALKKLTRPTVLSITKSSAALFVIGVWVAGILSDESAHATPTAITTVTTTAPPVRTTHDIPHGSADNNA